MTEKKMLARPVVLYDGSCKFCVTSTEQLREFDKEQRIEWLDLTHPSARARFPKIDWERAKEEIHLVHRDGRVVTGTRALHDIADLIGGELGHLAAKAMELPGVQEAADVIYHIISQNRFKLFGEQKK